MITSITNDRVQYVSLLQTQRRARRKANQFVIEGVKLSVEALDNNAPVDEVFYTLDFANSDTGTALLDRFSRAGARLMAVDEAVMQHISDTQTPQGILAVLPTFSPPLPESPEFILVIDGIADPGNMGTIMRTAVGAKVPLVIVTAGTVDLLNPKVVRSAMGAHFYLPVTQMSWEGMASRFSDHAFFLASVGNGTPYYRVNWTQPSALIVSEEAHGASSEATRLAHVHVTIPIERIESLNVAMATGILLFERQRQLADALH